MDNTLHYYELKQKYEENLKKRKLNIKKNKDLTTKERRTQLKRVIGNCVNCGKPGGTIFEERNSMLKAVCGSKTPCDLNIIIKRKLYDNVRELEIKNYKLIENLKMRIIMTKLDYLFGVNKSKDDTVDKFNKLKDELAQVSESQLINNKKYGDIISGVNRDPLLKDANASLVNEIVELKKTYEMYITADKNTTTESKSTYITGMVEQNINTIFPLVEKINKMKYGYYAVEFDDSDEIYTLVANPYRFDQLEQERK